MINILHVDIWIQVPINPLIMSLLARAQNGLFKQNKMVYQTLFLFLCKVTNCNLAPIVLAIQQYQSHVKQIIIALVVDQNVSVSLNNA